MLRTAASHQIQECLFPCTMQPGLHLGSSIAPAAALAQITMKTWVRSRTSHHVAHRTASPPDILDNALLALVIADHCLGPPSASARVEAAQLAPLWGHWILAGLSTAVIWAAMHDLKAARR